MNYSYYPDTYGGQELFRCKICPYDTFSLKNIEIHQHEHPPIVLPFAGLDAAEWLLIEREAQRLKGKSIGLCFLTWNTREASTLAAKALAAEAYRLRLLGAKSKIYWYDNGSDDGTVEDVSKAFQHESVMLIRTQCNVGISIARNHLIQNAVDVDKCDYILMLDGDIEPIPYSVYAMTVFLQTYNRRLDDRQMGCFGLHSANCTATDDKYVAQDMRSVAQVLVKGVPHIAWTQYGVFLADVFRSGIRFETSGSFGSPGWGFEDNDLYCQMHVNGFSSFNTCHWRYMHRRRNSSIPLLGKEVTAQAFNRRKDYFLDKWKNIPEVEHVVKACKGAQLPV